MKIRRLLLLSLFLLTVSLSSAYPASEPPLLTEIEVGDSTCRIEWNKVRGAIGYNVYIENEDGKFNRLNERAMVSSNVNLVSLINGMPYRFAITSVDADGVESAIAETGPVVPVGRANKVLLLKGGSSAADYHIFSTPFRSDRNKPQDLFAYFPKYNKNQWRLFAMDKGGYSEFGDIERIEPGKAYWFLSRNDSELFLSGKTVNNYRPFKVQISPGWNVISSPFLYPIEWREALIHNRDFAEYIGREIWEFSEGGFKKAKMMEPFKGYFVFNSSGNDLNILIPPVPAQPRVFSEAGLQAAYPMSGNRLAGEAGTGWQVKLSADDGIYHDDDNFFGQHKGAKNGIDRMDGLEPPAWRQHLSLYFALEGEGRSGQRYASDISRNRSEWAFMVEGGENAVVKLEWEISQETQNLELFDMVENYTVYMGRTDSYTFRRDDIATPRRFIVRYR